MLNICAKMSNALARGKKIDLSSVEELPALCVQFNALKVNLEEWKQDLPPYYDPIILPMSGLAFDDPEILVGYPYGIRHEYIA